MAIRYFLFLICLSDVAESKTTFTIATVPNENVFEIFFSENGKIVPCDGPEVKVLETVIQMLNAEIRVVIPDDHDWGSEKADGNFSGMIGMLQRQEADFAVNEIAVTEDRSKVVDYSPAYITSPVTFFTKAPALKDKLFVYSNPFGGMVWVFLLATLFIVTSILKVHLFVQESTATCSFFMLNFHLFGILVNQSCERRFTGNSVRILLGVWMLSGAILIMSYIAVLLSLILLPVKEPALKTVKDLSNAVASGSYSCGILTGTATQDIFLKSKSGTMRLLGQHIRMHRNLFPSDRKLVVEAIQDRNFAFIGAKQYTQLYLAAHQPENFYVSDDFFMIAYGAVAMRKGLPEKPIIDNVIQHINQGGLYNKWVADRLFKIKLKSNSQKEYKKKRALRLVDIKGAFLVLGLGYLISFSALGIECFPSLRKSLRKRTFLRNYKRRLIVKRIDVRKELSTVE